MADWSAFLQGFANSGGGDALSRLLIGEQEKDPLEELFNSNYWKGFQATGNPIFLKGVDRDLQQGILKDFDAMPNRKTETEYSFTDNPSIDINTPQYQTMQGAIEDDLQLNKPQIDLDVDSPRLTQQANQTIDRRTTQENDDSFNKRITEEFIRTIMPQQEQESLDPSKYITENQFNTLDENERNLYSPYDYNGQTVYVRNAMDSSLIKEDKEKSLGAGDYITEEQYNSLADWQKNAYSQTDNNGQTVYVRNALDKGFMNEPEDEPEIGITFDDIQQNPEEYFIKGEEPQSDRFRIIDVPEVGLEDDYVRAVEKIDYEEPEELSVSQLRGFAKDYNNGSIGLSDNMKQQIRSAGIKLKEPEVDTGGSGSTGTSKEYSSENELWKDVRLDNVNDLPRTFNRNFGDRENKEEIKESLLANMESEAKSRRVKELLDTRGVNYTLNKLRTGTEITTDNRKALENAREQAEEEIDKYMKIYYGDILGDWADEYDEQQNIITINDLTDEEIQSNANELYNAFVNSNKFEGTLEDNKDMIIKDLMEAGNSEKLANTIYENMLKLDEEDEENTGSKIWNGIIDIFQ
jgi:hypothetical protein